MGDLIECPRCNEADERSLGFNRCGLCECTFVVGSTGRTQVVSPDWLSHVKKLKNASGSDDGGNIRSSFG
jgi:hypothetical protein